MVKLDNILVIYKKGRYGMYRDSPDSGTRRYMSDYAVQQPGAGERRKLLEAHVQRMRDAEESNQNCLEMVVAELEKRRICFDTVFRGDLRPGHFLLRTAILCVGGDGTVLDASHYITDDTPLLGINSDPGRSTGFFSHASRDTLVATLDSINTVPTTAVDRFALRITDIEGNTMTPPPVLNDFKVANASPGDGCKYLLEVDGKIINPSGKGGDAVIVCTPAGSTAWVYECNGEVMPMDRFRIQYVRTGIRGEKPGIADQLSVTSLTRSGVVFPDGRHMPYQFGLGSVLSVEKGPKLTIVGDLAAKRQPYINAAKKPC